MLLGKAQEARQRRLRDCHQVGALRDVLCGTLELVEQCRARRARALRERQKRSLAALRPWPLVAGIEREHHAVDYQRVHAGREELREPHVGQCAVCTCSLEDVVPRTTLLGGSSRLAAATASMARRSPISCSSSPSRAARYCADSPGNLTVMPSPLR